MKRFITSDGLQLAYKDEGKGIPVLCLAGLTRNHMDFDDLAAQVGREVRLIRLDYRGRGASDYDPTYQNYAVPVEARDAVELLDHLGVPKAVILGTSRGGMIAMVLAATVKDRLAGVLLNDIGPEIDAAGLETIMGYVGRNPSYKSYDEASTGLAEFYADSFSGVSTERWAVCARRWFDQGEDGLKIRYDPKLRDALVENSAQPVPDLWPFFDALEGLPLALVWGENSDLLTKPTVDEMQRRRADMILARVPRRGHVPFLDEPEALAAFRALLKKCEISG